MEVAREWKTKWIALDYRGDVGLIYGYTATYRDFTPLSVPQMGKQREM